MILQYRNVAYATKPLQTFEETKNPVDKLATDKLQLLLINVLITSLLNIGFSQGSVSKRLRCCRIFNNPTSTQSLLSRLVKEF